jgi:hypothetical protein
VVCASKIETGVPFSCLWQKKVISMAHQRQIYGRKKYVLGVHVTSFGGIGGTLTS